MVPTKRKDGRSPFYRVSLKDPFTGKRKVVSLKTTKRSEAVALAADLIAQSRSIREGTASCTLAQALDAYTALLRSEGKVSAEAVAKLSDKTLGRGVWAQAGRFHLDPSLPLTGLSTPLLANLVTARRKEGNSAQTIAHEIKDLRAATRYAKQCGYAIPQAMFEASREDPWRFPTLTTKTRFLTMDEWRAVYDHMAPGRDIEATRGNQTWTHRFSEGSVIYRQRQDAQDLFVALTMCGGRWGEVKRLRWDRVDAIGRVIRLYGRKTQQDRLVGMAAAMAEMLERRALERKPAIELVFPNSKGMERGASCRAISRALNACGLNDNKDRVSEEGTATVHTLRHTFASWLLQNGASLADLQDALGHASLAMTRRYAHLLRAESATKLAGIMDKVMGK